MNKNFSERLNKSFSEVPSFYKGTWNDAVDIKKNPITKEEKSLIPIVKEFFHEGALIAKMYPSDERVPDGLANQTYNKYASKCKMYGDSFTILIERLKAAKLV